MVLLGIHPDFEQERQRLDFTKRYMDVVIKTSETSKDQFQRNMQEAFGDADWSESGLYSQLLTTANFFEMSKTELESLSKASKKPYFARVDFERNDSDSGEVLYFGKTSLYQRESQEQIIVDWRSPIANLYYEGRIGEIEYEAEGEKFSGNITLKRQLMIEEGVLEEIRDIDLTTTDELLQESLSKSSSNRLTDIITTIQEEQNKIIRADLNKPIIVQGAAGSGKTTIALHRISYFIYHYKDLFDPRQLMILAPSRVFIDYISEALPELGVEKVKQFTFSEYVQAAIGKQVKLVADDKLTRLLEKDDEEINSAVWISGLKGSPAFKCILDEYVKDIFRGFHPDADFYCDKYRLYSAKKFIRLLEEDYWYLPLYSRLDKLKAILQNEVKLKKKTMLERVVDFYEAKIEKALYKNIDPVIRKEFVTKCLDKKEERIGQIKKAIRSSVKGYFKQFKSKDLLDYYQELYQDPERLASYSNGKLNVEDARVLCEYNHKLFTAKSYEMEDLGALLYLQERLFGVDKENKAKNVVIDEAQDYSFMQLQALKTAVDTDMFTLVGDLAQGIHSYRGLQTWEEVHSRIFPRATYTELQKSYRTTVEIMKRANEILQLLTYDFPEVEPVVRHGKDPEFISIEKEGWEEGLIELIASLKGEGFKTFAVIAKTMKDCKLANEKLSGLHKGFHLIDEAGNIPKDKTLIVPSYQAKGLEFDVVFAISLEEAYCPGNELDIKLLYVTMTRPLHRLYFLGNEKNAFLIDA
ncbi:UvrD-helicase domain-containing protein [Peribacillus simplex]|uniref:HelD family protein n=1 Tax=Peribacillus simplex TaxID=1478 RepID=UPI002E2180D7|nr:UvrD-helicase domain-containing protein [Peribacillus simplex]MED3984902.1 UvrD-helicase domain-containing protein [Peribacillus simplex]MED4097465.1 UvrD-helicase domain-containing protein [Peribacillus simplex]